MNMQDLESMSLVSVTILSFHSQMLCISYKKCPWKEGEKHLHSLCLTTLRGPYWNPLGILLSLISLIWKSGIHLMEKSYHLTFVVKALIVLKFLLSIW